MSDEYNIEVVKCLDLTTLDHFRESVIEFCEKNQEFGDALKGYEIYKKKMLPHAKKVNNIAYVYRILICEKGSMTNISMVKWTKLI